MRPCAFRVCTKCRLRRPRNYNSQDACVHTGGMLCISIYRLRLIVYPLQKLIHSGYCRYNYPPLLFLSLKTPYNASFTWGNAKCHFKLLDAGFSLILQSHPHRSQCHSSYQPSSSCKCHIMIVSALPHFGHSGLGALFERSNL